MSATNSTTYYELPIFVGTDKPAWLTDWNGAMNAIDSAIKEAKTAGDNAQTTANTNTSSINTLGGSVDTLSTSLSTLTTTVNGNTGSINTINSLIGHGEPTTTDKTLIGAINELNAEISGAGSGLETRVGALETSVGAIETEIGDTALPTTAQTLTGAIAEIAQGGGAGGADLNFVHSATGTVTPETGLSVNTDVTEVKALTNTDYSIGKIYGGVTLTGSFTGTGTGIEWNKIATISGLGMPTIAESYNIAIGYSDVIVPTGQSAVLTRLVFKTTGDVDLEVKILPTTIITQIQASLPPCIYILKDLGD